jgi:hypothetical protein
MSRPMPGPMPDTIATFPSSSCVPMCGSLSTS